MKPTPQRLDPREIRMDRNTQARKETCEETVREYAELMEGGATFPPCTVFFDVDTQEYIMADGFHRLLAHLQARPNDAIEVEQYIGNAADTLWFAIGANKSHGLKRSNEDKRNAIEFALLHVKGAGMSDRQVAEHVGVAFKTVGNVRRDLVNDGRLCNLHSRIGKDGRTYNISNIGKSAENPLCCRDCEYFEDDNCELEDEPRAAETPACEDYMTPQPEPVRYEGVRFQSDDDPDNPKDVSHRPGKLPKGEYVQVPLDRLNTEHAACEIRLFMGGSYLAGLAQSALKILKEDPK